MKLFPIVFFLLAVACLAVAAAQEARDGICNAKKTPTKLIARRTWPSQTAITTTTAQPTTVKTTSSSTTTTAEPSTVSTTRPTTTTTMATTTTPLPNLFNCSVSKPECGNMCGNATSATTGVIQSPNFPGDYGNYYRRYCQITITAPAGWMMQLNFTTFNVETNAAYVQIGEMSITGNTIPDLLLAATEMMSIGFLYAASTKPTSAVYNWQATLSVTSDRSSCSVGDLASACRSICTNATSAGTGVVQSPNYPGDYGNEFYSCYVTIIVPMGKRIQLNYNTFKLETGAAVLSVSDKNTVYLSGATGSTIPAAITTSSNVMYIGFNSFGGNKPNSAIYNWQATYTAV